MSNPETTPRTLTIQQLERINAASAMNQQRVADKLRDLAILATDANVAERRTALQCQGCSYLSRYRISGQAFTRWNCQICKLEQRAHHNTGVPISCEPCAKAFGLCVTCGGDLEMRNRGRLTGRRQAKVKR